ncbi:ubiquinol-cytochrome c reductase iron-sulfur subunit [Streptomyces sp. NPDC050516]|uniref:ubiquinol-cytochrome c reductase iron-sulfur subunit n=1 Tax=Streptomyces sp. NPDC050516 TaxID=3365621 RepID=UPI00379C0996
MSSDALWRYVEALLRSGRPRPFRTRPQDIEVLRTAITLRAARPGSDVPREEFVSALHARLAREMAEGEPGARPVAERRPGSTRRRVVQGGALVAASAVGVVVGRSLDGGATGPTEQGGSASGTLQPNRGEWRTVAAGADLPSGAVRGFATGTVSGFVSRDGARLRAVSGVCTHQGCALVLDRAARQLDCPCHNSAFAVTGEVLHHQLPVHLAALPRIAVREADGQVQVYVPPPSGVTPPPIQG